MTDEFPPTVPVEILEMRRQGFDPELARDLEQLSGGAPFQPERFLRARAVEATAILKERRARGYLVPRLGHVIQVLSSAVFSREPRVKIEGGNADDPAWRRLLSAEDGGTADLNAILRSALERALLHGEAEVRVDFPRRPAGARIATIADSDALGLREPVLIPLEPGQLRDFDIDERGSLRWATTAFESGKRASALSAAKQVERRWYVDTPAGFAVYKNSERAGESPKHPMATLEAHGAHTFGRVPIARLVLPARLALGPLLASLARQLTELDNAISWQQFMSLFAMPVIKTSKKFDQLVGEAYAVTLEPGDSFEWAEPKGTALALSMQHRDRLHEELYRCAHGVALGFSADATTAGRSGESKRQDFRGTEYALQHLGALVRDMALEIVSLIAAGRGEKIRATVTGLDSFDLESTAKRLEEHALADSLIRSPQWRVERGRSLARRVMPELSETSLATIDAELEAAKDDDGINLPRGFDDGDGDE